MVDPDQIQIQEHNLSSNITLTSKEIPECDIECWCLEDDKDYEKFIRTVENTVRRSFEYREFIKYIRENFGMDKCAFLKDVNNKETYGIKIEIHHYPFSLRDIADIVVRKRSYYKESLSVQMVAKEIMQLHYKLMIGLIPLSETVHELFHSSRLFIPIDKVVGRYRLFMDVYKPFISSEQLDTVERIEKYTDDNDGKILNTNIIEQNKLTYSINDSHYLLPDTGIIANNMLEQMKAIKDNNYLLPSISEVEAMQKEKEYICPLEFFNEENGGDEL